MSHQISYSVPVEPLRVFAFPARCKSAGSLSGYLVLGCLLYTPIPENNKKN